MISNLPSRYLLASVALASALAAQVPAQPVDPNHAGGMLSALPAGLSLDDSTAPAGFVESLLYVPPPAVAGSPQDIGQPGGNQSNGGQTPPRPDYSLDSVLAHIHADYRANFSFDAIDTGNAGLPLQFRLRTYGQGARGAYPVLNNERWLVLTVSIATPPAPVGGEQPWSNILFPSANPGSDLVSYAFQHSSTLTDELVGTARLEQTSTDLGLASGDDVNALDFPLGILAGNPDESFLAFAPNENLLFFSVTKSWVDFVLNTPPVGHGPLQSFASLGEGGALDQSPDAAVIYRMRWHETTQQWGAPYVYRTRHELGLTSSPDEDVDMITINDSNGNVIFSTKPLAGVHRNQLLVSTPALGPGHHTLIEKDGGKVTDRIGLEDQDDVDGGCGSDPETVGGTKVKAIGVPVKYTFWKAVGAQLGGVFANLNEPISLSVARTADAPAGYDFTYHFTIRGWGELGVPDAGLVQLRIRDNNDNGTNPGTWASLGDFPRGATQHVWHLSIPVNVPTPTPDVVEFEATTWTPTHPGATWPVKVSYDN